MDRIVLENGRIGAGIKLHGAEPCSLTAVGAEYLWQAGPAWPRHAPVLFPIVGRIRDDRYEIAGTSYELKQHGFARDTPFEIAERSEQACRLVLEDDEATRARYPFAFRLEAAYALNGPTFSADYTVTNTGDVTLPASLGAHPAFAWPLAPDVPKEAHVLEFARPETSTLRGVTGGLLTAEAKPSPIEGNVLHLKEELFAHDALVLDAAVNEGVRFTAPGAPVLDIAWHDAPQLGIWMKPGADFLCIEPWHGHASPAGFAGSLLDKPGQWLIPPGESRTMGWSVTFS